MHFNPRAPHGGASVGSLAGAWAGAFQSTRPAWGRENVVTRVFPTQLFQSTRPAWGREPELVWNEVIYLYFNPRAPHGGANRPDNDILPTGLFQSTRPAWGRDNRMAFKSYFMEFQSTRPAWGRDLKCCRYVISTAISIHAPRMGARQEA